MKLSIAVSSRKVSDMAWVLCSTARRAFTKANGKMIREAAAVWKGTQMVIDMKATS